MSSTVDHEHVATLDRVYRHQTRIYDLTRRYYLLGREQLLHRLPVRPGSRVVEIGCGTARNLIHLARRHPAARFYGLDASHVMLANAARRVAHAGLEERISLRHGLAEELTPDGSFGLQSSLDVAFFSYSLTMMPACTRALDAAVAAVRPGGTVHIVDFWDQRDLPAWFRQGLAWWLRCFHVQHRPELVAHLQHLEATGLGRLHLQALGGRYACLACFTRAG
jgi:S-adenosylmethionine-diacylgycerolhomoserine-N-methlytransferase